jgi:nuclear protein localization family protein 4
VSGVVTAATKAKEDSAAAAAAAAAAPPPAWLCNHPSTVFCPNCIPRDHEAERKAAAEKTNTTFVSFRKFAQDLRARSGPNAIIPSMPSYAALKNCPAGHRPWPFGVCLRCAPANAHLRLQPYRHLDGVSFQDVRALQTFHAEWVQRGVHLQRGAILFGTYMDEPSDPLQLRAMVYAIYEAPQESQPNGVKFLRDPRETAAHAVARAAGLEPVGWVITTQPRRGEKYAGHVFLSGPEARQAARFQRRYADPVDGRSRFVTVVLEFGNEVEPRAHQVSDQAVALERDNVLGNAEDPWVLATRKPAAGELMPKVVYKDKPLKPGAEFLVDELLVRVRVMAPQQPEPRFAHNDFPSTGTELHLRSYLAEHAHEPLPQRLSDFNVLVALAEFIGLPLVERTARALAKPGAPADPALVADLRAALAAKGFPA